MPETSEQYLVRKLREAGDRIHDLEQINSKLGRYLDAAGLLDERGNYTGPQPSEL